MDDFKAEFESLLRRRTEGPAAGMGLGREGRLAMRLGMVDRAMRSIVSDKRLHSIDHGLLGGRRRRLAEYAASGGSVYVHGPVDSGKSAWAAAATRKRLRLEAGRVTAEESEAEVDGPEPTLDFTSRTAFVVVDDAIRSLQQEFSTGKRGLLDGLGAVEWLCLDDLGARSKFSAFVADELASLIDRRYRGELTTVFTSNTDPEGFGELISKSLDSKAGRMVGERTVSRIYGLIGSMKPATFSGGHDAPHRRIT